MDYEKLSFWLPVFGILKEFDFWLPPLGVLISVLFVNYFIPIKNRSDHTVATTVSAGITFVVGGLIIGAKLIFFMTVGLVIMVFVADFFSTFINFTNRMTNAIVTTIVFTLLYFGAFVALIVEAFFNRGH
jgi:hypothetical protein